MTSDSPLSGAGTSVSHLIIPQATTFANGYLSSTDWNTFNGKQANLSLTQGTYSDGKFCTYSSSGTVLNCTSSSGSGTVTSVGLSSPNTTLSVGSTPITTSGTITADINWTDVNGIATINTGGINWNSFNSLAKINSSGINWNNINAIQMINGGSLVNSIAIPGSPTTTTQSSSDNSTKIATTAFVTTAASTLVPYSGATGSVDLNAQSFKNFYISQTADATAKFGFDVSSLSTATTRTLTVPNRSFTFDNITTSSTTSGTGFVKGNGSNISFDNTTYQPTLSLVAGTYANGGFCTYSSSGTILNCNSSAGTGTVTSIGINSPNSTIITTSSPVTTSGTIGQDINWTDVNGIAAINTGGINWNSFNSLAKVNSSGVNWNNVNSIQAINGGAIVNSIAIPGSPTTTTQAASDNSTKVATTAYVTTGISNAIAGVNPAIAVQAATTAAGDTSGLTYNNGVAGVGATLTGTANTAITIDGYTFTAVGQRLLVKNDTQSPSGAFNGIYYVTTLQALGVPLVLTRALDYDQPSDINNTGSIPVVNGTVNGTTSWVLTSQVTTMGTDPLTYTQFSLNPTTIVTTSRNINTTSPLTGGGNLSADRTIAIPAATGSANGYLASGDWTTFNNKQANLSLAAGTYTDGKFCTYTASGTVLNCTSSAGNGTVTSVGLSSPNTTLSVGSTPVTTSGTITADINWTDVNGIASINTGGINWNSFNSIAKVNTGSINWNSINSLSSINSSGVNWQNITNYMVNNVLQATTANGVNWTASNLIGGWADVTNADCPSAGVFTAVSSITCNVTAGNNYEILFTTIQNTSNGYYYLTFNGDSGSNYSWANVNGYSGGTGWGGGNSVTKLEFSGGGGNVTTSGKRSYYVMTISPLNTNNEFATITGITYPNYASSFQAGSSSGQYLGSAATTSFTITTSAGTMTGTVVVKQG